MQPVRHWTTPNDANYSNRHARCMEIEFFAFPHQSYLARIGNTQGMVAQPGDGRAYAQIFHCLPDGKARCLLSASFNAEGSVVSGSTRPLDMAISWAAEMMHNIEFDKLKTERDF